MDIQTPKAMRRAPRNIFQKLSESLNKWEQNLSQSSPHLSVDSRASFHSAPEVHHTEDHRNQDDSTSLQHYPNSPMESPKVVLTHKHVDHPSTPSRLNSIPEFNEPTTRSSSIHHDQEMQVVCQELMENKITKLHACRDYDKKVSLLRVAVSFNTPKIIVPVLLYLENTLSKPLFYELLRQHPSAIKNYINLAKLRLDDEHYIAMLKQFGKDKNVAMIRVRQASQTNQLNNKIALLEQASIDFHSHPWWYSQVVDYQHLLRKQQELQRHLSAVQPGIQLENQTLLRTYKIVFDVDFRQQRYKRNTDKTIGERVKKLESDFNMSSEMIMCGQLSVIMKCGYRNHFHDFVEHAFHQGVFGRKCIVSPENLADMVYKWIVSSGEGEEKASEKAGEFVSLIPDPDRRIYYAEKFRNYNIAMDTIANDLRDRAELENLRRRIPQDHPSFHRAASLLENTRWRN